MTHEEFEKWKAGFDGNGQSERIAIARQKFLKVFNLNEEEALEIIGVFERKGPPAFEDADGAWYYYYWIEDEKLDLENKVDELEAEVYRKSEVILRLKSNFLEVINFIYHSGSIQEAREYIDKTLDID